MRVLIVVLAVVFVAISKHTKDKRSPFLKRIHVVSLWLLIFLVSVDCGPLPQTSMTREFSVQAVLNVKCFINTLEKTN